MSVVAVKIYDDKVVIASDSILAHGSTDVQSTVKNFTKMKSINNMIIAGCGYAQELGMMWHFAENHILTNASEKDVLNFMVEFSEFKGKFGGGYNIQNSYIIVFDAHAYLVEGTFAYEIKEYCAIGAGEKYAIAALHLGHSPQEAVKVACDLSCYVAEPIIDMVQYKK